MHITIKYFGQIAEATKKTEEQLEVDAKLVSELITLLHDKYNVLKNKDYQVAQQQELVDLNTALTGEEIALLPPFSGG